MSKSLENMIAVIVAVLLFFILPIMMADAHFSRCFTVTGQGSVQELASEISRTCELTVFSYDQHASELYDCGFEGGLEISCYTYEKTADGSGIGSQQRRYMTTWDEIRETMLAEGEYIFPCNAYVVVTAKAFRGEPSFLVRFLRTRTDYSVSSYIERGYGE